MIAKVILIITIYTSRGVAIDHIEMNSYADCQQTAQQLVRENANNIWHTVRCSCVEVTK